VVQFWGPHKTSVVCFMGRGATASKAKLLAKSQNEQQWRARDEERRITLV